MYKPLKQGQGRDLTETLGSRQLSAEQLTEARRSYRLDICSLPLSVVYIGSVLGSVVVGRRTSDRKIASSTPGRCIVGYPRSTQPSIHPG